MLTKAWKKIDRFYIILVFVLIVLVAPLIYTVLGVFSAFVTAHEIDTTIGKEVRVNTTKLDSAISKVYDKEKVSFEVKDISIPPATTNNENNQ